MSENENQNQIATEVVATEAVADVVTEVVATRSVTEVVFEAPSEIPAETPAEALSETPAAVAPEAVQDSLGLGVRLPAGCGRGPSLHGV